MTLIETRVPGQRMLSDTREQHPRRQDELRRYGQIGAGALLALYGLRRGGWLGFGAILAGGVLAGTARTMQNRRASARWAHAEAAITVAAPPLELYDRFRALERLPEIISHLESVEEIDAVRSTWQVRGPGGLKFRWESEIVEDIPGERLSWRAIEHADVEHTGVVTFRPAPGDRGTEMRIVLRYGPPLGRVGAVAAGLMGYDPAQTLESDFYRFKQLIETGEEITTVGQSAAREHGEGRVAGAITAVARSMEVASGTPEPVSPEGVQP